ncbi:MAG TPA: transglutaminase family protein [Roseiflexaceae bacterium]|nr:transglutaminase family protein [Roseiflexaceae bacterium]
MRLHIDHETIFSYSQLVREAVGEARLRPRDDAGQRLIGFRLALDPHTPFDTVSDRFGNTIHCYSVLPAHRRLVVTATSEVETSADALIATPALTLLEQHSFTATSPYLPVTEELLAFSRANTPADADPEATARALTGAIYDNCAYEPGSTDISTTAEAVLAGRRGVCQDFAHLLIALCRGIGLPARYISGYLFDPDKPPDAVLASHAWTEVYLDGRGWLGLDPTHNRATGPLYTRVAIGRDYGDAAPVRGIYQGGAKETLEVRVRMRAVGEPAPIVR